MRKRHLFLDIDGVINTQPTWCQNRKFGRKFNAHSFRWMLDYTDKYHFRLLKLILSEVEAINVVITSSWRKEFGLQDFKNLFEYYEIHGNRVVGMTDYLERGNTFDGANRVFEIKKYITDNELGDWACLDDRELPFEGSDVCRFIQTDPRLGLTINEAERVVKLFKPYQYEYSGW